MTQLNAELELARRELTRTARDFHATVSGSRRWNDARLAEKQARHNFILAAMAAGIPESDAWHQADILDQRARRWHYANRQR